MVCQDFSLGKEGKEIQDKKLKKKQAEVMSDIRHGEEKGKNLRQRFGSFQFNSRQYFVLFYFFMVTSNLKKHSQNKLLL